MILLGLCEGYLALVGLYLKKRVRVGCGKGWDARRLRLYDCLTGGRIQTKRKLSVSHICKRNCESYRDYRKQYFALKKQFAAKRIEFLIVI